MCVCVCVCVCVLDGQGGRVFASTAVVLVVVWMTMYLTSYMDCQTGLCGPLSPPYRCHTGLEHVYSLVQALMCVCV